MNSQKTSINIQLFVDSIFIYAVIWEECHTVQKTGQLDKKWMEGTHLIGPNRNDEKDVEITRSEVAYLGLWSHHQGKYW